MKLGPLMVTTFSSSAMFILPTISVESDAKKRRIFAARWLYWSLLFVIISEWKDIYE